MRKKDFDLMKYIKQFLTDETKRQRFQFGICYLIFSIVSFLMAIVNAMTGFTHLMYVTLIFGILNAVNAGLNILNGKKNYIARTLFAIEILIMFTDFIVVGEPEGFSAIWCVLLPACGLLLYGVRFGTLLSFIQFMILVFFFWNPYGTQFLHWEYEDQFMLRMPLLYLAFYVIGFMFEMIRSITMGELFVARDKYKKQSLICALTGLGSRTAYFQQVLEEEKAIDENKAEYGIASLDVNGLKFINDTFGHIYGDKLLIEAADTLKEIFTTSKLFHTGGDEFVIILHGDDLYNLEDRKKKLKERAEYREFESDGKKLFLSVSSGYSLVRTNERYQDTFKRADVEMYEAKKRIKEQYHILGR